MNQERKEELVVRWMDDVTLSASEKEELNRILGLSLSFRSCAQDTRVCVRN